MENFSENAIKILKARYFLKENEGIKPETKPSELFRRVAKHISKCEKTEKLRDKWEEDFFRIMIERKFMPNSPTLTGADRGLCLSACFVLPVEDSLEAIFETVKNAALIHKEGGGTGFDFSKLRSKGSIVKKTMGTASGPVSFLKVIDAGTEAVKQGGTRRGANMGVLRIDHPDIEEFITLKLDQKTAQNFNISVAITDEFIKAYENGTPFELKEPSTGKTVKKILPEKLFNMIVDSAWRNGDPGLIFIDRVNRDNPTKMAGEISATNPCGEQPLHPYEACNLGSVNLSELYAPDTDDLFNWDEFRKIIRTAVRFLDNVIEKNIYPLQKIEDIVKKNRRIGLGIMGFADLLIKMKTPYNSAKAFNIADRIMKFMKEEAASASSELAEERGSFPNIDKSVYKGSRMRNASLISIAPTGTISRIAGCSSGIEPVFSFKTISKIMDSEIVDIHPEFKAWEEKHQGLTPPEYFVSADKIDPIIHLKMQEIFQNHTDSAVSKTINFHNKATREEIAESYKAAFNMNIKGITVYRDGCRRHQVLNKASDSATKQLGRPDNLPSATHRITTGLGKLYVTISYFNQKPFEVFCSIGKSGYSTMADAEALGRLISLALRSGIHIKEIIKQIKGIGGSESAFHNGSIVQSIPDAVAQVLEKITGKIDTNKKDIVRLTCPVCGSDLRDERCPTCPGCGWTKCSGS